MPRGKVSGPDPRWDGARPFDEEPTSYINAPPTYRSEFMAPPPVDQPVPDFLRGAGGGTPQPDPIQVTGVTNRMQIDPIELSGSGSVAQIANRGMPGGGDADRFPEPPPGPQAKQGIPEMLARPPEAVRARLAAKPKMAAVVAPGQAQTPSRPVTDSGSTSPDFDAYVAQRAREIADLKAAQGTADQARKWQDVANGFVRAGDAVAGRKSDEAALQQRLDNTNRPVENMLQQQQAGRAATNEALAQTSLSGKMWEQRMATQAADPNSPISQRMQGFLASTGLFPKGSEKYVSAADFKNALDAGAQGIHSLALKAQIAHQNAQLEIEKGKAAEDIRHHNQEYDIGMYKTRKEIPPTQQSEVEALIGKGRSVKDLIDAHDKAGPLDVVGSYFGMGDYDAMKKASGPEIAKGDAKGTVRPTGAIKASASLPNFGPGSRKQLVDTYNNAKRDSEAKLREMEANPRSLPEHVAELRNQHNEVFGNGGGSTATRGGSAGGMVEIVDANGNHGQIPAANLQAALARGARRAQ